MKNDGLFKFLALLMLVAAAPASKPTSQPTGDLVDQVSIGMKERVMARLLKLKPISREEGNTNYRLPNGATASCFGGEVYYFFLQPAVGMPEREFLHFNQSNRLLRGGKGQIHSLYRVVRDSEESTVYRNEYHTVVVRKDTGRISVVADP